MKIKTFVTSLVLFAGLCVSSQAIAATPNYYYLKIWAPIGWTIDTSGLSGQYKTQCTNSDKTELVVQTKTETTDLDFTLPVAEDGTDGKVKATLHFYLSATYPALFGTESFKAVFQTANSAFGNVIISSRLYQTAVLQYTGSDTALAYCSNSNGCAGVVQLYAHYVTPPASAGKFQKTPSIAASTRGADCAPTIYPSYDPLGA